MMAASVPRNYSEIPSSSTSEMERQMHPESCFDDEWRDFAFKDANGTRIVVRSTSLAVARRIAKRKAGTPVNHLN
jgi:hypothetical protein